MLASEQRLAGIAAVLSPRFFGERPARPLLSRPISVPRRSARWRWASAVCCRAYRRRRHCAPATADRPPMALSADRRPAVAIYPLAFYASMRLAGVTVGTVISIGSAPLLSALIEYRLDGLRLTKQWASGALIGLIGMALLCPAKSGGHGEADHAIVGMLLGLLAGFTYALYSRSARRLMQQKIAPRAAMGATFGAGGILLMPVLLFTGAPLLTAWNNAAVGIYMALVPMFIGYLCYGYGLARIPASPPLPLRCWSRW